MSNSVPKIEKTFLLNIWTLMRHHDSNAKQLEIERVTDFKFYMNKYVMILTVSVHSSVILKLSVN